MTHRHRSVMASLAWLSLIPAVWTNALAEVAPLEPIHGFKSAEVYVYHKPTKERPGNRLKSNRKTSVQSFGPASEVFISLYWPANKLITLLTAGGEEVVVEFDEVDAVNQADVDREMNVSVPLGTCMSGLAAGSSAGSGGRRGTSRGIGC